jgi:D-glycero-alpha-D-manno-heptose-7-phosphate kinase
MIVTRAPFRISFAGGGTDLRAFYSVEQGAVTSTAIDKYMYITVNRRFDRTMRISYLKTEIVDEVDQIAHPIVRESLRLCGIDSQIEVTSVADIPAGTGVGSSSSFAVGLLAALHAYKGENVSPERLASEACEIEIQRLGEPIGKQDQYIAAFGGLKYIRFNSDETVEVEPIPCPATTQDSLSENLLLLFTGKRRSAGDVLRLQEENTPQMLDSLRSLRDLAAEVAAILRRGQDLTELGRLLHEGWLLKKKINPGMTDEEIDACYERALQAGAVGGKLLGAGGGGFLLLYCKEGARRRIREALRDLREVPFRLEPEGVKVIYSENSRFPG